MKVLEIYESETSGGTFIGIKLHDQSNKQLEEWCNENHINCDPPFHVTLILDKNQKFSYAPVKYNPPIILNQKTYKFDIFDNGLVLTFDSDKLSKKHLMLRDKYNIEWDYDEYKPHITLDYEWDAVKSNRIKLPDFPIKLSHEYKEGFESLKEEIEHTGHIQGELLSAMSDSGDFVHIKWQDMDKTEGYQMMSDPGVDPTFKIKMNQIFKRYLGVDMEDTITASTAANDKTNIFKIIKYLQRNVNQKTGINPNVFKLHIPNYQVNQASVFHWRGAKFLVIKDTMGPPQQMGVVGSKRATHYSIYAAKD